MGYLKRELNQQIPLNILHRRYRELLLENEKVPEKLNLTKTYMGTPNNNNKNHNNNFIYVNSFSSNPEIPGEIDYEYLLSLIEKVHPALWREIKETEAVIKAEDPINNFMQVENLIDEIINKPFAENLMDVDDIVRIDMNRDVSYMKQLRKTISSLKEKRKTYVNFPKLHLYSVFQLYSNSCFLMVPNIWRDITFQKIVDLMSFIFNIISNRIFSSKFSNANNLLNQATSKIVNLLKLNYCDGVLQNTISNGITAEDVRKSIDFSPNSLIKIARKKSKQFRGKNISSDIYDGKSDATRMLDEDWEEPTGEEKMVANEMEGKIYYSSPIKTDIIFNTRKRPHLRSHQKMIYFP